MAQLPAQVCRSGRVFSVRSANAEKDQKNGAHAEHAHLIEELRQRPFCRQQAWQIHHHKERDKEHSANFLLMRQHHLLLRHAIIFQRRQIEAHHFPDEQIAGDDHHRDQEHIEREQRIVDREAFTQKCVERVQTNQAPW